MFYKAWYLNGEVASHETYGQKENAQLSKEGGAPAQTGGGLGVRLSRQVEVLKDGVSP